ncbi:helix-turn-helix domain-containing protein [Bradyrhizobium sp.]|jgi:AraC family transcriptional regulator|uniref:helix-turn-helix domain-containing protein n=1 Tax=Bradyrhizobium sp. TaxID=376 RepID=UPI003C1642CF
MASQFPRRDPARNVLDAAGSADPHGYGTEKYGPDGLLVSSADRGWTGLSAALFQHGSGVLSWKNVQPDTEICVNLLGNQSVVTRTGGGIFDQTIAARGKLWMSPAGLQEDVLDISDHMPEVLHIYLPRSHFTPEGLGVDLDQSVIDSLRFESSFEDPLLAEIGYAIAAELETQTSAGRVLADTLASSLAARLLQKYVSRSPAQARSLVAQEGLDRRRLSRVLEYIDANLEGNLTLDELASIACLSRFHFARAFKAAVGRSPHQYVSAKRLERAKELLTRGDRPLVDIALALNFSSQANFSRAFRHMTGRAPGQFRRGST